MFPEMYRIYVVIGLIILDAMMMILHGGVLFIKIKKYEMKEEAIDFFEKLGDLPMNFKILNNTEGVYGRSYSDLYKYYKNEIERRI